MTLYIIIPLLMYALNSRKFRKNKMTRKSKHTEKFQNFNLIVFGGTGDLALRKIYPAYSTGIETNN